jgi:hypothetical protein
MHCRADREFSWLRLKKEKNFDIFSAVLIVVKSCTSTGLVWVFIWVKKKLKYFRKDVAQ